MFSKKYLKKQSPAPENLASLGTISEFLSLEAPKERIASDRGRAENLLLNFNTTLISSERKSYA